MFSVVIPVYNHADFLRFAVMSATRSRLVAEILLVDDGSTDASAMVCAELARNFGSKVRDLTDSKTGNRGKHSRLNQLCQAAKSTWIAVLDSDDEFVPGRFESAAILIRQYGLDFLCGSLLICDNQGRVHGVKRGILDPEYAIAPDLQNYGLIRNDMMLRILCNQNFIATTSNMLFRKDLFRKIGGFANLRYSNDWDFALRAMMLGKCLYTPTFFH